MLLLVGEVHPLAPFELLRNLPVLSGLRPATRFTLPFTLFGVAMAGWAVGRRLEHDAGSSGRRLLAPMCIAATLLLVAESRTPLEEGFSAAAVAGDLKLFRKALPRRSTIS
jgi:hypothetical protein